MNMLIAKSMLHHFYDLRTCLALTVSSVQVIYIDTKECTNDYEYH